MNKETAILRLKAMRAWAFRHRKKVMALVASFFLVGLLGLQIGQTRSWFQSQVPFALFLSAAVLLVYHRRYTRRFLWLSALVVAGGYAIEAVGVQTGLVFGEYSYGSALGIKLWGTPLLMGLNWWMMVYMSYVLAGLLPAGKLPKALMASALMVGYDFVLEPVAMALDFWQWPGGHVPLQNYLAWFAGALFFQLIWRWKPAHIENHAAPVLFLIQFLFFALQALV